MRIKQEIAIRQHTSSAVETQDSSIVVLVHRRKQAENHVVSHNTHIAYFNLPYVALAHQTVGTVLSLRIR